MATHKPNRKDARRTAFYKEPKGKQFHLDGEMARTMMMDKLFKK